MEYVKTRFTEGCRWLDAGGGRRIFHDLYDGERDLVTRARLVVAADGDLSSLAEHVSISKPPFSPTSPAFPWPVIRLTL